MNRYSFSRILFLLISGLILIFLVPFATGALTDNYGQDGKSLPWLSILLMNSDVRDYIRDVDTDDRVSESEIVIDQYDRSIALTKLMVVFKLNTTPNQISELLSSLNGMITSSVAGARSIVIRIPKPSDLAAYDAIMDQIEAKPYVAFVWAGILPEMDELPPNYNIDGSGGKTPYRELDHHLAVRAHAAWNIRRAINSKMPLVVVADKFGRGNPSTDAFDYVVKEEFGAFGTGLDGSGATVSQHGYGVLSVICGKYDGSEIPKGLFPDTVDLGVVDIAENFDVALESYDMPTIINKILNLLKKTTGNVVLNTSFSEPCINVGFKCQDEAYARKTASVWAAAVRDLGLETRVLHITTAGNTKEGVSMVNDAKTKTPFAAARLLENLTDVETGLVVPNLVNTLVVESAVHSPADDDSKRIVPVCQELHSFDGGDISAIGRDVVTSRDPYGVSKNWEYGTSFAAPQVAGLAAYLWSVKPSGTKLSPPNMITLLKDTAYDTPNASLSEECSGLEPAPTIDAYEALLSLDGTLSPATMEGWPVRFKLMDINNDNRFDEDDINQWYQAYFESNGKPRAPLRDFSRYDLNGDGWTTVKSLVEGNTKATMPFDLDREGSYQFGSSTLTGDVTLIINNDLVTFNELEVTDKDILCYYSYSNLYTGSTTLRDNKLLSTCSSKYTKIDPNGNDLPKTATDWVGVRDDRTFLIWEKKTDDGGLRDKNLTYHWYDPNPATNGGYAGDSEEPNTSSYTQYVNSQTLCGASNWRMPSVYELESLVEWFQGGWINTDYFPNTPAGHYWSSSTAFARAGYSSACIPTPAYAWYTNFGGGSSGCNSKSYHKAVRLVHDP